jgi:hypothetical protein
MKINKKTLITGCIVAAIALLLWFLLKPTKKPASNSGAVYIIYRNSEDVKQVTIDNENGSFTILQQNGEFICPELEGITLNNEKIELLIQNSSEIRAEESIKGAFLNLADYGLEEPVCYVEIVYTDERSLNIEIGNVNEDGTKIHFKIEGENTVYIAEIENFELFFADKKEIVSLYLSPLIVEGQETAFPSEITFSNEKGTITLIYDEEPYTDGFGNLHHWRIDGENSGYADDDRVESLFPSAMQLKASEVYILFPSAQDLERCGITENSPTLTIVHGAVSSELIIGVRTEAGVYVYKKGTNVIFIMPEAYYTFESANIHTVETRHVLAPAQAEVSAIYVQGPEAGQYFMIDIFEDGSGVIDGQRFSFSTFNSVYRMVCSLKGEYVMEEAITKEGEAAVEITVQYRNGERNVISLVPYDADRYAIFVNEEDAVYLVRTAYAEKLMHTLNQITEGQIIDPSW